MLRGGCAHGRSSSRPGCGAKWARHRILCAFDGGAHGASAPLSAPMRVNPGHTSEVNPHIANRTRWVPRGRRLWPPGPYLCPNSSRRSRPFAPPGRVEPRVTRIHPLLMCTIGLMWLSCTCGAQDLFTHAQVVRSCLPDSLKGVGLSVELLTGWRQTGCQCHQNRNRVFSVQ